MRFFVTVSLLCLLALTLGCSSKTKVTGKVTFEDGTPLTTGEVRFESSGKLASGKIQPDGTYSLGSVGESDGIEKGTYKVSIYAMDYSDAKSSGDPATAAPPKSLVAKKYQSAKTSELECVVDGTKVFDIKVEKP